MSDCGWVRNGGKCILEQELKEDITHILEVIEHNKDVIKVTSDEELAIYSLQEKMQEIEGDSDE